jgi:hypothetical protein
MPAIVLNDVVTGAKRMHMFHSARSLAKLLMIQSQHILVYSVSQHKIVRTPWTTDRLTPQTHDMQQRTSSLDLANAERACWLLQLQNTAVKDTVCVQGKLVPTGISHPFQQNPFAAYQHETILHRSMTSPSNAITNTATNHTKACARHRALPPPSARLEGTATAAAAPPPATS